MSSSCAKKIVVQCDGDGSSSRIIIEMKVALQSKVIAQLMRPALLDNLEEIVVVLPDIRFSTLLKVINYCTHHAEQSEDLDAFDAKFVDVDLASLFLITHAAKYLKIRTLMDLTCGALSNKIKGKTPEEIEEVVKNGKFCRDRVN